MITTDEDARRGYRSDRHRRAIEILDETIQQTRDAIGELHTRKRSREESLDLADLRLRLKILVAERDDLATR